TTGDVSGTVVVADSLVLNYNRPEEAPVTTEEEIEPTDAEAEILERLDLSQNGFLVVRREDGFAVEIDSAWVGGPFDERPEIDVQVHEALERLVREGLLRDVQGNGQTYYLSSKGRAVAQRVQMPQ